MPERPTSSSGCPPPWDRPASTTSSPRSSSRSARRPPDDERRGWARRGGRHGGDPGIPPPAAPTEPSEPFATADDEPATVAGPRPVPADPAAYDSERNAAARKRGLSTPYVPGGR